MSQVKIINDYCINFTLPGIEVITKYQMSYTILINFSFSIL